MSRMPPAPKKATPANQAGRTSKYALDLAIPIARAVAKEGVQLTPQRELKLQRDLQLAQLWATISTAQAMLALSKRIGERDRLIARLAQQVLGGTDLQLSPAEDDEELEMPDMNEEQQ